MDGVFACEIVGEPGKLFGAEIAHAAGLEVDHVDQADEMHALMIEGVPALALGLLAVTFQVGLAIILVDHVVFAGDIMNIEFRRTDDLVGVVEFLGLDRWEISPVWIMKAGFCGAALTLAIAS